MVKLRLKTEFILGRNPDSKGMNKLVTVQQANTDFTINEP